MIIGSSKYFRVLLYYNRYKGYKLTICLGIANTSCAMDVYSRKSSKAARIRGLLLCL